MGSGKGVGKERTCRGSGEGVEKERTCRGSGEGVGKERRRGLGTVIGLGSELKGKGRIGGTGVRGITDPIVLVFGMGGINFLIKTKVKMVIKKL